MTQFKVSRANRTSATESRDPPLPRSTHPFQSSPIPLSQRGNLAAALRQNTQLMQSFRAHPPRRGMDARKSRPETLHPEPSRDPFNPSPLYVESRPVIPDEAFFQGIQERRYSTPFFSLLSKLDSNWNNKNNKKIR